MIFRFVTAAALTAVISLAAASVGQAQEGQREAALKAAFLYNFAKFTEWPKNRPDGEVGPVTICFGQDSALRAAIGELQGKLIGSRPVRAVALADSSNPAICHLLFVDAGLPPRLRQLVDNGLHGVLTVSDLPNFARTGGDIGLFFSDNQLRFQINLDAARRGGLGFSSKLLRLADVIGQQSSLPSRFADGQASRIGWM